MISLAVAFVSCCARHVSTCRRIGSKFLCMRSTPTEIASTNEKLLECFANIGGVANRNTTFVLLPEPSGGENFSRLRVPRAVCSICAQILSRKPLSIVADSLSILRRGSPDSRKRSSNSPQLSFSLFASAWRASMEKRVAHSLWFVTPKTWHTPVQQLDRNQ